MVEHIHHPPPRLLRRASKDFSESSSTVECFLPKEEVAGSNPVSRSILLSGNPNFNASVAQLVEQCFRKAEVSGSIPLSGSNINFK